MDSFDINWVRAQFPALTKEVNGHPAIFLDGPGGSQTPAKVLKAMNDYMITSNANAHGPFVTSERTDATIASAREAVADLLGCSRDEIIFGANMTTLTFMLSRAIGRDLVPGDEIVVTKLDHDANISPWRALEEMGVVIREVDINPADCTLDMGDFRQKINARTKLVAVGYASNLTGTINDVAAVTSLAHSVGALVFVDGVHYAPHGPIDVKVLDCDFLTCSAYKFFGPHLGALYGKREHLTRLRPYKLRPASDVSPERWETGTLSHEALAGVTGTIGYLAELGRRASPSVTTRREALQAAMQAIQEYERELCRHLMGELAQIPGLTNFGITEPAELKHRTPTIALRLADRTPYEVAKALGGQGMFASHGNFYALSLCERLGVEATGGIVRIGLLHYNTIEEIDRVVQELNELAAQPAMKRVNGLGE